MGSFFLKLYFNIPIFLLLDWNLTYEMKYFGCNLTDTLYFKLFLNTNIINFVQK